MKMRLSAHAKPRYQFDTTSGKWGLVRATAISAIPRRGRWNKDDCVEWYRMGCPSVSTYTADVFGVARQIVGYDPDTDSLILGNSLTERSYG